jgi:hypothetical protein
MNDLGTYEPRQQNRDPGNMSCDFFMKKGLLRHPQ